MKFTRSLGAVSGPLLVLSSQVVACNNAQLEVTDIIKVTASNQGSFRPFMEFSVAGQKMMGLVDTGSSDWLLPKTGSDLCEGPNQQCDKPGFHTGSFDPEKAGKDYHDTHVPFNASYSGGTRYLGTYFQAPLQVRPGGKVFDATMGLIESGEVPEGAPVFPVLGLAPVDGEFAENIYPNVPARLKETNITKVNAFGLFLGDFRSPDNGSIVWGGYDAAKFDGELQAVPIVRAQYMPWFMVNISSIRVSPSTDSEGKASPKTSALSSEAVSRLESRTVLQAAPEPRDVFRRSRQRQYRHGSLPMSSKAVFRRAQDGNILGPDEIPSFILDSGDPGIELPVTTLQALAKAVNATIYEGGMIGADCERLKNTDLVFGLNKDKLQLRVPLYAAVPVENSRTTNGQCLAFIGQASPDFFPVLGAPALQHIYGVFDSDSEVVMLAQAKPNETRSDIREYIPNGCKK